MGSDKSWRSGISCAPWVQQVPLIVVCTELCVSSHFSVPASHYSLTRICPHTVELSVVSVHIVPILIRLTSETRHPLRHNIHNGLKIFTIPRMMSCDHKKPHFLDPATILPVDTWPTWPGIILRITSDNQPIGTWESGHQPIRVSHSAPLSLMTLFAL